MITVEIIKKLLLLVIVIIFYFDVLRYVLNSKSWRFQTCIEDVEVSYSIILCMHCERKVCYNYSLLALGPPGSNMFCSLVNLVSFSL